MNYQDVLFYSTLKMVMGLFGFALCLTVGWFGQRLAKAGLNVFGWLND